MKIRDLYINDPNNESKGDVVTVEFPTECPCCRARTHAIFLTGYFDGNNSSALKALYHCSCGEIFCLKQEQDTGILDGYPYIFDYTYRITGIFPSQFHSRKFEDSIHELSSEFVKIYNESAEAESLGLFEICGMGYRKAIEHLVKDYCVSKEWDSDIIEAIKVENLGATINRITDTNLRSFAFAAKELGNDQVHPVRKQAEGLKEMKEYIDGLVAFIHYETLAKHAHNQYKKQ